MKGIKEKQMLINMARALGQEPDPGLVREVEEYNNLIQNITPVAGNEFNIFLEELSNLKKQVKIIEEAPVIFEKVNIDFPKPPTVEELLNLYTESKPDSSKIKLSEDIVIAVKDNSVTKIPTLVDLVSKHITQEAKFEERTSLAPPDLSGIATIKTLDDVKRKLRYLENWVSKISSSPGSGEVNLLRLDDVDSSSLGDNKSLFYNASTAKLEFRLPPAPNLLSISSALIPDTDSVYNLGTANLRWGTLFLANNTIDLGGALISSDGSGTITISSTGAVLPVNSKISVGGVDKNIAFVGTTGAVTTVVPFFTQATGLNTIATNFSFGANPDDYVFTNFTLDDGVPITQASVAQFYF